MATGSYDASWGEEAERAQAGIWVSTEAMEGFILGALAQGFTTVDGRNKIKENLGALPHAKPFRHDKRYPQFETYVNIAEGDWAGKVRQLTTSLDYKESDEQGRLKQQQAAPQSGESSKRRSTGGSVLLDNEDQEGPLLGQNAFDKALLGFHYALQNMQSQLGKGVTSNVYGRNGFERLYSLNWA
jgi:hypothetical protein